MQHFDEQPMRRKIKLDVIKEFIIIFYSTHLKSTTLALMSLQKPAPYTEIMLHKSVCNLLIIKHEFASFRNGYCFPSPFQMFNTPAVTPPCIYCSMNFAFSPSPINLLSTPLSPSPPGPFTKVSSSVAEVRAWDTETMYCHTASPPGLLLGEQPVNWLMFSRHP